MDYSNFDALYAPTEADFAEASRSVVDYILDHIEVDWEDEDFRSFESIDTEIRSGRYRVGISYTYTWRSEELILQLIHEDCPDDGWYYDLYLTREDEIRLNEGLVRILNEAQNDAYWEDLNHRHLMLSYY